MRLCRVVLVTILVVLISIGSATMQTTPVSREVAFTFDDLPATRSAELATMQETTASLICVRLAPTVLCPPISGTRSITLVNAFPRASGALVDAIVLDALATNSRSR